MILKSLLILLSCFQGNQCEDEVFDYIVVGAGPAGSMVATELAQHGQKTLLIDAGTDIANYNTTVPLFVSRSWIDPDLSWGFNVNYYNETTELRRNMYYPRGSGIGGSANINGMVNIYPNSMDFQRMVDLTGDNNWAESNFRRFFNSIKLSPNQDNQDNHIDSVNRHFYPLGGVEKNKIIVEDSKNEGLFKLTDIPMANQKTRFDLNGYDAQGNLNIDSSNYFFMTPNIDYDVLPPIRTTVRKYVNRVLKDNPNLTVWPNTLVTKVLLENKVAIGVEYMSGKYLYGANNHSPPPGSPQPPIQTVFARKEIIISGGVFNSPQILMLSRIGDSTELIAKGITPQVDLSGVGKNLQDHYECPVLVELDSNWEVTKNCDFKPNETNPCFQSYLTGHGPYVNPPAFYGAVFKTEPSLEYPDILHYAIPGRFVGFQLGGEKEMFSPNSFTILVQRLHPNSLKGMLKLVSNDPRDPPSINLNYFGENAESDLKPLTWGIKRALSDLRESGWNFTQVLPPANVQTDEEIVDYLRKYTFSHHACCTNKIGADNDSAAVLDGQFRVRGVKNLRVVDQSSIPNVFGSFPTLVTHLIGLKAAHDILQA